MDVPKGGSLNDYRAPIRGSGYALVALAAGLALPAAPAQASEWVLGPRVSVSATHDDNVGLEMTDPVSATGVVLAPELLLRRRTEITQVDARAALRLARYPGEDEDLDRDEGRFDLRARRQGERSAWNMNARYRRDTTLRSAFDDISAEEPGFEEPIADDPALDDPDLGLVSVRVRRTRLDLAPRWEYAVNPRLTSQFGYRYQSVSYGDDDLPDGGLLDFDRHRVESGLRYALTERTRLTGTVLAERHRVDEVDSRTDNLELRGGFRHLLTETLDASLEAGARRTRFDTPEDDASSSGFVLDGALDYRTEVTRLRGFLRRTVQPSGAGRTLETDRLEVRMQRALTSRVELMLAGHVLRTEPITAAGETRPGRQYYELEPMLRWHFAEEWSLAGSVRYRRNKRDADGETAESRAVFLGVTWEPRLITLR